MYFYSKKTFIFVTIISSIINIGFDNNPAFTEEYPNGSMEMKLIHTIEGKLIVVRFMLGEPLMEGLAFSYLSQTNNLWLITSSGITKSPLDSSPDVFFPFDEKITHFEHNQEMVKSGHPISPDHFTTKENMRKDLVKNHQGQVKWLINPERHTQVSPDEHFALVRYFADNSELYEIQTGKFVTSGEDGETIIGFSRDGHYYCARQSLENTFYLRDKNTGEIIRRYRTITNGMNNRRDFENTTHEDFTPFFDGLLFNNSRPVIESPDGKYTLFSFTLYQLGNYLSIIIVCENGTGKTVSYSCLRNTYFSLSRHVFSHDGKLVALSDGGTGVWLYNFETKSSQNVYIPNGLTDFSFTAQNQLVLWCDPYLTQQKISPFEFPIDPSTGRIMLPIDPTTGRMTLPASSAGKSAYLFDSPTGSLTPFTSFADKDEYVMQYRFSPDGRTVLTFVSDPMDYRRENTGKWVFWDVQTNQKICETPMRYYPTMIISPDWVTLYLGRELPPKQSVNDESENSRLQAVVEVYDITSIINRP